MTNIDAVVCAYRQAAIGTSLTADVAKANMCARDLHVQYVTLRETQSGRDAVTSLMTDEDANVRLWAARHSLEWAPDSAMAVLEQLSEAAGLMSFTAEMTIKEYKKGRLLFGPAAGGPAGKMPQKSASVRNRDVVTRDDAAAAFYGSNPGAGDRAAIAMYSAHGLIMNGGVLNFVEIKNDAELEAAQASYRFFGFDGIADLLSRAKSLVDRPATLPHDESKSQSRVSPLAQTMHQSDLGQIEKQLDSGYTSYIADDSALQERYEQIRRTRPGDFVDS